MLSPILKKKTHWPVTLKKIVWNKWVEKINPYISLLFPDFTSVNSFNVGGEGGEGIKFSSPCLYDLGNLHTLANGGVVKNGKRLNKSMSATLPLENYYAATDIVKVRN